MFRQWIRRIAYLLLSGIAWPADAATNAQMSNLGLLSVKQYGAVGNGTTDDTTAIQNCINAAVAAEKAVFFPAGTYLVSNTIESVQLVSGANGTVDMYKAGQLIGSTAGVRPKIKLKDSATGFGSASSPKSLIYLAAEWADGTEKNSVNFEQGIRGVDIEVGTGNAGAQAIEFEGSQQCFLEDIKITMTSGYCGLKDLIGQNCSFGNIQIVGGKYGVVASKGKYPGIFGVTFENQTHAAVYNLTCYPFILTGFKIHKSQAPAIITGNPSTNSMGDITLVDGSIEFDTTNSQAAIDNTSGQSFVMRNVYFKNAGNIIVSGSNVVPGGSGWKRVDEYVHPHGGGKGINVVNGTTNTTIYSTVNSSNAPPSDLISRHLWKLADYPSADVIWDACNSGSTTMCVATNHGVIAAGPASSDQSVTGTDCTAALQSCIDNFEYVLLPKGRYLVSAPIKLKANTKLLGAATINTCIRTHDNWNPTQANRGEVITTADSPTAAPKMAFLEVSWSTAPDANDWFTAIHWRAGKQSATRALWLRSLWSANPRGSANPKTDLLFDGNAGGHHWGFGTGRDIHTDTEPDFRRMRINGTSQPLLFYNANIEGAYGDWQAEITGSSNIVIYGLKSENLNTLLFDSCTNCAVFSYCGGEPRIKFMGNSNNMYVGEIGPKFNDHTSDMITEVFSGKTVNVNALNKVLGVFRRGTMNWDNVIISENGNAATMNPAWLMTD